jgi:hypothetical protein
MKNIKNLIKSKWSNNKIILNFFIKDIIIYNINI